MKRIIIGNRGSDTAMWISKPGKDATSTSDDDMLVSPSRFLVQPYMQGHIYAANNSPYGGSTTTVSTVVTHNLGYIPVVETFGTVRGTDPVIVNVTTTTLQFASNKTNNGYAIDVIYLIFRLQLSPS